MSFVVSAVVTTVGTVAGAAIGAKGAKSAAKRVASAEDRATQEQARQYDQTREDYQPYREAGYNALGNLQDPNAFQASPGYEFVRNEGQRDIGNAFSARNSGGNAMRALAEFNQGLASQEYGNWWNRQSGMANLGMGGVGGTAQAGMNAANNNSNSIMQSGRMQANLVNQRYSGINNAIQSGLGNALYMYQYANPRPGGSRGPR